MNGRIKSTDTSIRPTLSITVHFVFYWNSNFLPRMQAKYLKFLHGIKNLLNGFSGQAQNLWTSTIIYGPRFARSVNDGLGP